MTIPAFATMGADAQRRRALRQMRSVALSLLVFAAIVYAVTLNRDGGWGYVHATAEAAMVGAIADWFAVTAIFRHPMGLRIPHTAIIPVRKDTLARSLREFVTENFLSEDVVRTRVADAEVSRRIGAWLSEPAHSVRVVDEAAVLLRAGISQVRSEDVATVLETEILPRLAAEPLSEVMGRLLQDVVEEGAHHGLVDLALTEAHRWLSTNEKAVADALSSRAPWWTPQWLDEQVTHRLHAEVVAWVTDIREDVHHPGRRALDDLLASLAYDLQHDRETKASAERLKERVLAQPQVVVTATSLWEGLRRALMDSLADEQSAVRTRAAESLSAFGARLDSDGVLRARIDGYVADTAAFVMTRYGDELTTVITDTIERWDGKEAADRIELFVGRDLQFIRINGTLVGGLAGLVIYSLSRLA